MPSLADIEALTKAFSQARNDLSAAVTDLEDEVAKLKRARMPRVRRLVETVATRRNELHAAIEEAPGLFKRPKTLIFHGVKIGFAKGKGKLEFTDGDQVVKLIRRHFPDKFDELVKVTERPVRGALNQLSVADLRRIGVTVIEAGDEVVISPTDSEIDKLVDALLKDAEEKETVG